MKNIITGDPWKLGRENDKGIMYLLTVLKAMQFKKCQYWLYLQQKEGTRQRKGREMKLGMASVEISQTFCWLVGG